MVALSGPGWQLAPCLEAMFEEADERDPNRDHSGDGSIGDAAHAARESDHNPADGWVCGADIDDDDDEANPGVDLLRAHLVVEQDPRIKYLIRNGSIWKAYPSNGLPAWVPQVYTGLNAHKSHLHISVWNTAEARNDLRPWWPHSQPAPAPPITSEDDMTFVHVTDSGRYYMVNGGKVTSLTGAEVWRLVADGWQPRKMLLATWNKVT